MVFSSGTSSSGNTGAVNIGSGAATTGGGGAVSLTVGSGDSGVGGAVSITAGDTTDTVGGAINIKTGANAAGGATNPGTLTLESGDSTTIATLASTFDLTSSGNIGLSTTGSAAIALTSASSITLAADSGSFVSLGSAPLQGWNVGTPSTQSGVQGAYTITSNETVGQYTREFTVAATTPGTDIVTVSNSQIAVGDMVMAMVTTACGTDEPMAVTATTIAAGQVDIGVSTSSECGINSTYTVTFMVLKQ